MLFPFIFCILNKEFERSTSMLYTEKDKQVVKEIIDKELAIKKAPQEQLEDCLMGHTKERLLRIRDILAVTGINTRHRKQEIVDKLMEATKEAFVQEVSYLTRHQYETLTDNSSCLNKTLTLDEVLEADFLFPLLDHGWLFLYLKGGSYTFVMPNELRT